MSRRLLCEQCGEGRAAGRRKVFEATEWEAAEWMRTVWGLAAQPVAAEQRQIRVTGALGTEVIQLPIDAWTCDQCSAAITPGTVACAETIWLDGQPEPPSWESEFLSAAGGAP